MADQYTQETSKPHGGHDFATKFINAMRWICAVVLPIPTAWIVSAVNRFCAYRYIDVDESVWFRIYDSGLQGAIIAFCAYKIVPRAKFYSASIISTVYATINVISIILWCIKCPFDIWRFIQYIASPVGMVLGIIAISQDEP